MAFFPFERIIAMERFTAIKVNDQTETVGDDYLAASGGARYVKLSSDSTLRKDFASFAAANLAELDNFQNPYHEE